MNLNSDWKKDTIELERVFFKFNTKAESEIKEYVYSLLTKQHVDETKVEIENLKEFRSDIERLRSEVDDGQKFVVIHAIDDFGPIETEKLHWIISKALGETIVQNEEGRHLVHIYDRDPQRRIKDGARYHQTHESGAIHTDNVNIPENYQYLLVGCAMPAKIGGENIIVNGRAVYDYLNAHARTELEILKSDFVFEYRGISRELYHAPIITFSERGEPLFRHLRTYMESAHLRADKPLTSEQIRALDTLDATLSMTDFQIVYRLKPGEILIANDSQVLHDRRCFVDGENFTTLDEFKANPNEKRPMKRTLLRTWVRKI
jgi:hypothetical protein